MLKKLAAFKGIQLVVLQMVLMILISCSSQRPETTDEASQAAAPAAPEPESAPNSAPGLDLALLGVYQGVQPGYNLKNKFGDDLLINGKTVPVPSIDYKFLLSEGSKVSLQQTAMNDGRRVYYEGTFRMLEDNNDRVRIECNVSDGDGSSPTYVLEIARDGGTARCTGDGQPAFDLVKAGQEQESSASPPDEPADVNGLYYYGDNSVEITVNVRSGSWMGKTKIISGFGDEYDNQSVEYENGVVNGSELYDESGYVKIGFVSGNRLNTTIGGQSVTLTRR